MSTPTIIITDHDEVYLEMVCELLESEGYPRILCLQSHEAWAAILQEPAVSLVFISMSLRYPDEAWNLLDKLRLHPPTTKVPVVLSATDARTLTAKADHLTRLNCSILEKPFLITDLVDLVRQLIGPPPERERTA